MIARHCLKYKAKSGRLLTSTNFSKSILINISYRGTNPLICNYEIILVMTYYENKVGQKARSHVMTPLFLIGLRICFGKLPSKHNFHYPLLFKLHFVTNSLFAT